MNGKLKAQRAGFIVNPQARPSSGSIQLLCLLHWKVD